MVDDGPRQPAFPLRLISRLFLFDMPRRFNTDLGQLWVDNLVYADPWKQFINRANLEWKEAAQGSAVLILSVLEQGVMDPVLITSIMITDCMRSSTQHR